MAHLLHRLGTSAARLRWRVVVAWFAVLALGVGAFLAFGGTLVSTFSIPGTETDRVAAQLAEEVPGASGATGTVVLRTEDGQPFTAEQEAAVATALDDVAGLDGVASTVDPFATQDQIEQQRQQLADGADQLEAGRAELESGQEQLDAAAAQLQAAGVPLSAAPDLEAQQSQLDAGRAELEAQAQQLELGQELADLSSGIRTVSQDGTTALAVVQFTQDQFSLPEAVRTGVVDRLEQADLPGVQVDFSSEIANSTDGILGPGEVIGVVVAGVVLLVMLRGLLPAALPIVTSLTGVGIGVTASLAFSDVVQMASVTPALGVMLGLAVGIDYSLFIINRHRRQLRDGVGVRESIGLANGTAGSAVVFAGSTVLLALLGLNVTGIGFLGTMGTVGAVCVLVAVLMAVTFTPAVLGLLGDRVLGRGGHRHQAAHVDTARPMSTTKAVLGVVLPVVALLVVAVPALSIRLGLPSGAQEAEDTTAYQAYTAAAEAFGPGQNGPLVVTADLPEPVAEDEELATQVEVAQQVAALDDVVAVAPAGVSADRSFFAFQVVPQDGPSSASTEQLVQDLRALQPTVDTLPAGADGEVQVGVAGAASGNIDISDRLAEVLPLYLALVIGLSLVILVVVFRSLLVPVLATAGFALSLFAALGAVTAVYQWGWLADVFGVTTPGPVLNFAPLLLVGILFGLAMDYQLFVVSGMREAYVHGEPARRAVMVGLRSGRPVVVAAAIIMVSVFGGFVFSHLAAVKPIGFGLATGVLFDAFVVRLVLVPAVMHLVGRGAWWLPRWLDRVLPHVDVEGSALEREHPGGGAAQREPREAAAPAAR
ncbi:MMPL family transporter [Pseudokineococcus marinus]|uniref:MMPL family transporter n=1 Tax=Pseudokineococcus marinus TaxID=351215 RepID=A0A849BNC5_9ACTN|nr:MMPL family transporter [Pseudokineococcus marinus]NNH22905.1 MMPL family transporter [Pseudokineococcus marinus]